MKDENIDIIIIRGCPASGKSQTAKSLSHYFPKGIRLEVDTLRQMVISVDWTNQQEHINLLQVSAGLIIHFLKLGFSPVIVVDTFSGDTLKQLDKEFLIKIFGLFTTDAELKRRLDLRKDKEFKDFPICKKLNEDVLKWKHHSEYQIDTTRLSPTQTADKIYGQINSI